jgi:hypothetical protein
MAHYVIRYKGKHLINMDLAKNVLGKSYKELMSIQKDTPEVFTKILDELFMELPFTNNEVALKRLSLANVNDISKQLENLEPVKEAKEGFQIEKAGPFFALDGLRFVRFSDILDVGKYRNKNRYPHIKMCGNIYVALQAKIKGVEGCYYVSCSE